MNPFSDPNRDHFSYPNPHPMSSNFPGSASAVHFPYLLPSNGSAALFTRSLAEHESQHLRPVKQQRTLSSSGISFDQRGQNRKPPDVHPPRVGASASDFEKKQLQELERTLLLDDVDDDDDEVSITGSTLTSTSQAMQQLISPSAPPRHQSSPLSPPMTSSTSSSSASCPPPMTLSSTAPSVTSSKQLLLETATAIADGNFKAASASLAVLKSTANPRGDPELRLTAAMVGALVSRANPTSSSLLVAADLFSAEHQTSTQMLYDSCPCFRLGLVGANLAILDAMNGRSEIHVVDFDFGQGGQYASLISAIAESARNRRSALKAPPPLLKITAVADPTFKFTTPDTLNNLYVIGSKIVTLGKRFGLAVRFNVVNQTVSELNRTVLGCKPGEALAVNFAFVLSRIADESVSPANPRDELLRRVKSLEPTIVTMVEQEMNANTAPFVARFSEACNYYGAVLDSLDVLLNRDSLDRIRIESCLGRKAVNLIAREGVERVERPEVHGKWRARMSMAGFKPVLFGSEVCELVKLQFGSMKLNPGFMYKEEGNGFGFGWMGRVLTVASAWR